MFYRNMITYRRKGNFVFATRVQSAHKFGGETIYGSLSSVPIPELFAGHTEWVRRQIDEYLVAKEQRKAA